MVLEVSACQKKARRKNTTLQAAKECFHLVAFAKETPSLLRLFFCVPGWTSSALFLFAFANNRQDGGGGGGRGRKGCQGRWTSVRPFLRAQTRKHFHFHKRTWLRLKARAQARRKMPAFRQLMANHSINQLLPLLRE